jgi:hypothetical protein
MANPEIGERLFISPRTVECHLHKLFSELGIGSRNELHAPSAALPTPRGWFSPNPGGSANLRSAGELTPGAPVQSRRPA